MARLDRYAARDIGYNYGIPLDVDYHTLSADQVERLLSAADYRGYRKPKHANGSRATCFHAYLRRAARQED